MRETGGSAAALTLALTLLFAGCGTERSTAGYPPPAEAAVPEPDLQGAEPQVAARILSSAAKVRAEPESAGTWGTLGMDLHVHGFIEEAAACYRRAAELDPSDPRWPYFTGLALEESDPDSALDWLAKASALPGAAPAVAVRHASALLALGRIDDAAKRFASARSSEVARPWALLGLSRVALRRGEIDQALSLLSEASAEAPHAGEIHRLRAQLLERQGRGEEAALAALSAAAHPEETGVPDPMQAGIRARGVSSRAWSRRGLRLEQAGDYAGAEKAFREVLAIRPGEARDHSNLGGVLAAQNRIDEALAEYAAALEIDPGEASTHNNLAMTVLRTGDTGRAVRHLEEAISADPSFADAYHNLGLIRARRGDNTEAERLFRKCLDLAPAHPGALNDLGTTLLSTGRAEEGMSLWRRAIAIDPMNLDASYNLVTALVARGRHREAVGELEAALTRAPDSSILIRLLA